MENLENGKSTTRQWLIFGLLVLVSTIMIYLNHSDADNSHGEDTKVLTWIVAIILAGKLGGGLINKIGLPPVVGQLVVGIVMGNIWMLDVGIFNGASSNPVIHMLGELGVIILLFQAGLHTSVKEMRTTFKSSFAVAFLGVAAPMIAGTIGSVWIFKEADLSEHLFFAMTMCATSVGITLAIFKNFGKMKSPEYRVTNGAAVFDDVLVLGLASVIISAHTTGYFSAGLLINKIVLAATFFVLAIKGGQLLSPVIAKGFSLLSKEYAQARIIFLLAICFLTALLAEQFGISLILGAFTAGLFLEEVHFKSLSSGEEKSMEQVIEPISFFVVPIFFVTTGMSMDISIFSKPSIVITSLILGVVMIASKVVSGFAARKVANPWIVGFGMAPRGEVGLVLAVIGKASGILTDEGYSIAVAVVVITTLLSPIVLSRIIKRSDAKALALGEVKKVA